MRVGLVMYNLGKVSIVVAVSMILPLICSIYYGSGDFVALLSTMVLALGAGSLFLAFFNSEKKEGLRQREGFALVTFAWLFIAIIGACPYIFSGVCPNFFDAFFESVAGFTTTGASILTDVDATPAGILMWRSLTHWLGGMGIVVLLVAFAAGSGGNKMYKAEAPGNSLLDKMTPRIGDASQILWLTYLAMTVVLIILLKLGGMNFFDSICHTFGALSTGGFSSHNASMGYYDSAYLQWVITIFMFFSGANFAYFYVVFIKRKNAFFKSEEFVTYFFIVLGAVGLITLNLLQTNFYPGENLEYVVRQSAFQVVSIITTTGFATTNFDLWPSFAKMLLLTLFFIGGCSGSTAGSIKVGRWIVAFKSSLLEFSRMIQPKISKSIKINKKTMPPNAVTNILQLIVIFFLLFFVGSIIMASQGLGLIESFSATIACLANVGPGFGIVGPNSNYSSITDLGKFVLSVLMIIGRLELYTVLVLCMPAVWRK